MCVPIDEIESGIWDEIELLTSPREIDNNNNNNNNETFFI